jgi:diaminopimelate decarboxylase
MFPIPDFAKYFGLFNQCLNRNPGQELHFELGRSIVGQCGKLFTKVLYTKVGVTAEFAVVDAGMTELMRPALYKAVHHMIPLDKTENVKNYHIVGPICESSDFLGKNVNLPTLSRGDVIQIDSVGAYGQVMSSRYNLRDLAKAYYSS